MLVRRAPDIIDFSPHYIELTKFLMLISLIAVYVAGMHAVFYAVITRSVSRFIHLDYGDAEEKGDEEGGCSAWAK